MYSPRSNALEQLQRLAAADDGSGIIEQELISFLDSLGEEAFSQPEIRILGQSLLGEVLTGLGEDTAVIKLLRRNLFDSFHLPGAGEIEAICSYAAQIVVVRLLRTIVRMEARELSLAIDEEASFVASCSLGVSEVIQVAFAMAAEALRATALDASPRELMAVAYRYEPEVAWLEDAELIEFHRELKQAAMDRAEQLWLTSCDTGSSSL